MEKQNDLPERFLDYLYAERQAEVDRLQASNRAYLAAQKRIRQLDKEIANLKGGAL